MQLVLLIQISNWSQMDNKPETWETVNSKNVKAIKTYGITSSSIACHLASHEVVPSEGYHLEKSFIFVTISTFDCDFVLLENEHETGKVHGDLQFKQRLKVRTHYPIMHCHLQYQFIPAQNKDCLIGYLVDIYSNFYSINFTKSITNNEKFAMHPTQFSTIYQNLVYPELGDKLYLEAPLMIKKCHAGIISVNLKGEILIYNVNQSRSWSRNDQFSINKVQLNNQALAATHNRVMGKQYESVIIIAAHNGRTPYVFVNCNSQIDFENQKLAQDKYDWIEESLQVSYCSMDPQTNLVAVSTVAQMVQIYEIASSGTFKYLKKRFGFFISNNLHTSNLNIDNNIESIHANRGLVFITTCKEYVIYDQSQRTILKRAKGTSISMMRWGEIIDRRQNLVAFCLIKGFNHINEAQSKIGKPNIHFKTVDLFKKDKF